MAKTILLTDDSKSIRAVIATVLKVAGYNVIEAGDGQEGLAILKSGKQVDMVITDLNMPNMNGIELLKLQRKRGCKALDANKALMSAVTTPRQQAEVKELGCHFFRKPFKLSEIKQWIDECAERIQ